MARPRKSPHELRSATVKFTLTPAEYMRLRKAAAAAQKSLSDYSRSMVLKGRITIPQTRALDHAAFDQIRRLGVNLNQAVRKLHTTGRVPPELARTAAMIERLVITAMSDGSESRR